MLLFSPVARHIQVAILVLILYTNSSLAQTAKRQIIPGTKYSLVPPKGFKPASGFSGFQDEGTGSSIMISELPAPLGDMLPSFTYEAFKGKGMEIIEREAMPFHNSEALYLHISQKSNGIAYLKHMLVFGDKNRTTIVNGSFPAENKQVSEAIKAAVLSAVYDEKAEADPLAAAGFSIDTKDSPFRFAQSVSGMLMYTLDGKIPSTKPLLIAGTSLGKIAAVKDRKKYTLERLEKMPGAENSTIKETNTITVDGLNGYEIVAEGSAKELIYIVMLYTAAADNYYIIYGSANEEQEHYLPQYRAIVKTFKRK